jgi:hypothetical protein
MLSISAFTAVMLLLGILAVAIRLLTLVFPPPRGAPAVAGVTAATTATAATAATATAAASSDAVDPHVLAAIHAAVQQRLPGGRVTHVAALPTEKPRGESAR